MRHAENAPDLPPRARSRLRFMRAISRANSPETTAAQACRKASAILKTPLRRTRRLHRLMLAWRGLIASSALPASPGSSS